MFNIIGNVYLHLHYFGPYFHLLMMVIWSRCCFKRLAKGEKVKIEQFFYFIFDIFLQV